jgi:hypothetical protein
MRGKVARALRREAFKFAVQTGRTVNRIAQLQHRFAFRYMLPALTPTGLPQFRIIRDVHMHDVIVDGPRFFYQRLKQGFMRGQIR